MRFALFLLVLLAVMFPPFAAIAQDAAAAGMDPVKLVGEIVALVLDNLGATGIAIASVVGAVAAIAAGLPNKSKVPWLNSILKLANVIGMNVGKSKNDPKIG